jgi:hypothetical protein
VSRIALTAVLLACAVPATAQAAPGTTTLTLGGSADAQLRAAGVQVSALAPATRAGRTLTLAATARTAAPARVTLSGGLRLRRGARTLRLASLRVGLGALPALTVRTGGKRRTLATVRVRGDVVDRAGDRVRIAGAPVTLTRAGGRLLRNRLGLGRRPNGRLATLGVEAAPPAPQAPGTPPDPGAPPPSSEPAPLARPATAVDVTSAEVTWHVRDSFIRYMAQGEGTSVHDGAVAGPPVTTPESDTPLVYDFHFPFASGWFDAASGAAAVGFTGRVRFSYEAHGIGLDTVAPELEINGAASRALMRVNGRREVLVDLRLDEAKAVTVDGATRTYEQVPGRIPAGAATGVFAGYYFAGDPFGWFTVRFTT